MRLPDEVADFATNARARYLGRCRCDPKRCLCHEKLRVAVAAYEACVPQIFWNVKEGDVEFNKRVFQHEVTTYVNNLNMALKRGYGLLFIGANGVGKTMFMSYILMKAIKAGRTAYYTSMPQMDYDVKAGWGNKALEQRLRWLLTSDYMAIDEIGKEHGQSGSYSDVQLERVLKKRCDDALPTLIATNMPYDQLVRRYGNTVGSMLIGHFRVALLEPGDYRGKMQGRMTSEMGYDDDI